MHTPEWKSRLLASSVLIGTTLALAGPAAAQDAAEEESRQETVFVTGSLIPQIGNLVETSPVTTIGTVDFQTRGVLRAEDMINTLPQAFGAQGSNLANGATGTATLDLRRLGTSRTLVLLNGRRLPYGSINTVGPDINTIPSALIEKVDILTGGASATYGSDALAGVVNFQLKDDFEGFRIDTNYSFFQHKNDGDLQPLLEEFAEINPDQYSVPTGSTIDGESIDITAVAGGEFDSGRGRISAFASFTNTNEILQGSRDYSQCALGTRNSGEEFTCSGSPTNQLANLLDLDADYAFPNGSAWARVAPDGSGTFISRDFATDTFNFNPYNHYQRPSERFTFGSFVNFEVRPGMEAYGEFMLVDNSTNSQVAPSGVFGLGVSGDNGGLNCDNPFLSDQQRDFICGEIADGVLDIDDDGNPVLDGEPDRAALEADAIAPFLILRRNVEGGNRVEDISHTTYRGVIGLRGDFGDTPLSYDLTAIYANVRRAEVYNNDLSKRKIANALYAVEDEDGNIVCRVNADDDPSNDDAACAPYDIFSPSGPSAESVAYVASPLHRDGDVTQTVVTATLAGPLESYGLIMPWAEDGLAFAAGTEYRRDYLDSRPDAGYQADDGAGQGGPTPPVSGTQEVWDLFGELNVPLIQGRPGIEQLGVDAAYRRSIYDSFEADTYKFGAEYAPSEDIRFRASFQRAVRAPNIFELFSPNSIGLFDLAEGSNGLYDPCAGEDPAATFEQCARTGVTAAQYGEIADNPAGQFNNLTGGNTDLEPESSDTVTVGFVATPRAVEGLTVSVDYFDIEVEDLIDTVSENLALTNCLETGSEYFCSLINRGAGGTLWANPTGYVIATDINTGSLSTSGVDIQARYTKDLDSYGSFTFDYVATWLESLETVPLPTSGPDEIYDCVGYYGASCGAPNPEYRHKFDVEWTNNRKLTLSGTWRYYGEVDVAASSSQPALAGSFAPVNETFDAQSYFDVAAVYDLSEKVTLRTGVNNIADEDPPLSSIVGTAPGNGNTYPQVYDAFGRYVFFGATLNF